MDEVSIPPLSPVDTKALVTPGHVASNVNYLLAWSAMTGIWGNLMLTGIMQSPPSLLGMTVIPSLTVLLIGGYWYLKGLLMPAHAIGKETGHAVSNVSLVLGHLLIAGTVVAIFIDSTYSLVSMATFPIATVAYVIGIAIAHNIGDAKIAEKTPAI